MKEFDKSGDLARLTGRTVRMIIFWADQGILRAEATGETQGRGDRRGYATQPLHGERKWALLADALGKHGLTIKGAAKIIDVLRERIAAGNEKSADAFYLTGAINGYLDPVYLAMIDRPGQDTEIRIFSSSVDLNEYPESCASIAVDQTGVGALMRSIGDADITFINLNRVFKRLRTA